MNETVVLTPERIFFAYVLYVLLALIVVQLAGAAWQSLHQARRGDDSDGQGSAGLIKAR
jgi:hypothetical protein